MHAACSVAVYGESPYNWKDDEQLPVLVMATISKLTSIDNQRISVQG